MVKDFAELAARGQQDLSADERAVYEAAVTVFRSEAQVRTELGAQLAAARTARNLTQPALSAQSGVQQAEISRIERGLGNPTATTLTRLATALGLRLELTPVP